MFFSPSRSRITLVVVVVRRSSSSPFFSMGGADAHRPLGGACVPTQRLLADLDAASQDALLPPVRKDKREEGKLECIRFFLPHLPIDLDLSQKKKNASVRPQARPRPRGLLRPFLRRAQGDLPSPRGRPRRRRGPEPRGDPAKRWQREGEDRGRGGNSIRRTRRPEEEARRTKRSRRRRQAPGPPGCLRPARLRRERA